MSGPREPAREHVPTRARRAEKRPFAWIGRYLRGRRGNVAAITALMIVPLVGMFALAGEGSYWGLVHRAEQNAADSAVMAAGNTYQSCVNNNNTGSAPSCGSSTYQPAGWAVATNYGFSNGASDSSGNTTVSIAGNVACPSNVKVNVTACFQATVTKTVPMYFVRIVGFNGNSTFSGGPYSGGRGQLISATAVAGSVQTPFPVCVLALDPNVKTDTGSNAAINLNGGNGVKGANLGDCTIFSDSNATCNGGNSGAIIGGAVGTNGGGAGGCGVTPYSNVAYVPDPYAGLASNIPAYTCPSNPGVTLANNNYTVATLTAALGGVTKTDAAGNTYIEVCGNLSLAAGATATLASGNAIVVINNGQLLFPLGSTTKMNTSGTAGMTLIFQGNSPTPFADVKNGGSGTYDTLDLAAPTSGTWSGVTLYDPVATSMDYYGNAPAWNLTGIVYFPKANINWYGVIGKATSGYQCFNLVSYTLQISGTQYMFYPSGGNAITNPNLQCHQAGVTSPQANIGTRYVLVS